MLLARRRLLHLLRRWRLADSHSGEKFTENSLLQKDTVASKGMPPRAMLGLEQTRTYIESTWEDTEIDSGERPVTPWTRSLQRFVQG